MTLTGGWYQGMWVMAESSGEVIEAARSRELIAVRESDVARVLESNRPPSSPYFNTVYRALVPQPTPAEVKDFYLYSEKSCEFFRRIVLTTNLPKNNNNNNNKEDDDDGEDEEEKKERTKKLATALRLMFLAHVLRALALVGVAPARHFSGEVTDTLLVTLADEDLAWEAVRGTFDEITYDRTENGLWT